MNVIVFPERPRPRWLAVVSYRVSAGLMTLRHELYELSELHDLVESGPHWDAITAILVHRINHDESPSLTLEQAAEL